MNTSEKIIYYRCSKGFTQEDLATRCGINVSTIRKYETNRRSPKIEQLKRLAEGLGISVIELLDIEIKDEDDLIAMLRKISPAFKWDKLNGILGRK